MIKIMIKNLLICLLILKSFILATASAEVTVTVEQQSYTFVYEPRLADVLSTIAHKQSWYWPSAALFKSENSDLETTRQLLLKNLTTLIESYKTDNANLAASLEQLKKTIASWRLAKRLPVKVDYDLARLVAASNPQLSHGQYLLELNQRKNTVQLFGAVHKTMQINHQNHADASQYLSEQMRSDLANKDHVILMQADGRKIKVPVAYWNKKHQEIMPGSQIFVPFKESIFHPEFSLVNQQIVTLALNRLQK
jgi:hypothetical protein